MNKPRLGANGGDSRTPPGVEPSEVLFLEAWYSTQPAILVTVMVSARETAVGAANRMAFRCVRKPRPDERACSINTIVDPVCGALARMP
jgi:hypothetical protein